MERRLIIPLPNFDLWCLQGKFVGEAMSAISANCDVPVSVKCRIGVDDHDSYSDLCETALPIHILLYICEIFFYCVCVDNYPISLILMVQ